MEKRTFKSVLIEWFVTFFTAAVFSMLVVQILRQSDVNFYTVIMAAAALVMLSISCMSLVTTITSTVVFKLQMMKKTQEV